MSGPSAEFRVGTADLRRGLQAVLPHVNPDPEQTATNKIRVELGQEVILLATDGFTAAMYATDATDVRTFNHDYIDLMPADVAKILAVFKAGKDDDPDYPDSVLEITATEKALRIVDVSGMFAGHELDLPAATGGDFPNVARTIRNRLDAGAPGSFDDDVVMVNHKMLGRFTASGNALGRKPLALDTSRSPYLVTCGEVFVGAIIPSRITEEVRGQVADQLGRWHDTARRVAAAHSSRKAEEATLDANLIRAVRAVGVRQAATVLGVAEALEIGKAEATDLLLSMEGHGLLERKGKRRVVLFAPDEVDAVLHSIAHPGEAVSGDLSGGTLPAVSSDPDAPERTAGDEPAADPFAPENFGPSLELPIDLPSDAPPDSPFSDPPVPPSPFTDSAGNEWPTTNPFGDKPA